MSGARLNVMRGGKKRKINHELKSHHKFLFSQHTPKANMVQLKTTLDTKKTFIKVKTKHFLGDPVKKLLRRLEEAKIFRQIKPKHRVEVKADGCATWKERQFGQTTSYAAIMRQNPSSEQAEMSRRKAKVIKQSRNLIETGKKRVALGLPTVPALLPKV